ncbi:MAG TPA: hypothetical protein VFW94_24235 [Candidatus Acidoferrales bacterium]|nr:hypothetical protein [Candidatus Acidoferrales bacterium]
MKDLIVVAGATHRHGMLDEYEAQLAAAGIDFHLWPLGPLPAGANSINMRRRIDYIRDAAQRFYDYSRIVMTDAWDVIFFGSADELMRKLGSFPTVSGERNCYPEPSLSEKIMGFTPWRFANNGMLYGSPEALLGFCLKAEETSDLNILDQAWFNRRLAEGTRLFEVDCATEIFYVVSSTLENGALEMSKGRPWNSRCGSFPMFFHFSGQCPTDRFRALLAGDIQAL